MLTDDVRFFFGANSGIEVIKSLYNLGLISITFQYLKIPPSLVSKGRGLV